MKTTLLTLFLLFIVSILWLPNSFAQYQEHTQKDLPRDAKARLETDYTDSADEVAFSPNGQMLANFSFNNSSRSRIHLWNPRTGELRRTLDWTELDASQLGAGGLAITPDSERVAIYSSAGITLWDAATGVIIRSIDPNEGDMERVGVDSNIVFHPWDDGMLIFGGQFMRLREEGGILRRVQAVNVWNVNAGFSHPKFPRPTKYTAGGRTYSLTGHTEPVRCVAISPNGGTIASGSDDKTVRLWKWSLRWGTIGTDNHSVLTGHTNTVSTVAFSPDGQTLASGSFDWTIRLWDLRTGELSDILEAEGELRSVAFSPDGWMLASSTERSNDLLLWDVRIRPIRLIHTFKGHTGGIRSVAFSPDGQTLASGSADGSVLLWEVPPAPPLPFLKLVEDVNADGIVNVQDLVFVAANLGKTGEHPADVNGDNVVNILDLTLVAKAIGNTAGTP